MLLNKNLMFILISPIFVFSCGQPASVDSSSSNLGDWKQHYNAALYQNTDPTQNTFEVNAGISLGANSGFDGAMVNLTSPASLTANTIPMSQIQQYCTYNPVAEETWQFFILPIIFFTINWVRQCSDYNYHAN